MGKYESSAIAEAVAHQRAETKIIVFTGFAYRDIAPELFPKLRGQLEFTIILYKCPISVKLAENPLVR